jgi:uncharacterized membrane protein
MSQPMGGSNPSGTVSPNRTVMIVLSYLWLLALVPLLVEKDDKEVQWHAKHGLVLAVVELIFWIALHFLTAALMMAAGLGCNLALISPLFGLAFLVVHIMCIVKGVNGQRFIIPGISQFADRF